MGVCVWVLHLPHGCGQLLLQVSRGAADAFPADCGADTVGWQTRSLEVLEAGFADTLRRVVSEPLDALPTALGMLIAMGWDAHTLSRVAQSPAVLALVCACDVHACACVGMCDGRQVSDNIEHREPRVRTCVVDLLEWLSRRSGTPTYAFIQDKVLASILTNFTRSGESDDEDEAGDGPGRAGAGVGPSRERSPSPAPRAGSPAPGGVGAGDGASVGGSSTSSARGRKPRIAHDTVGWKALESSIKAMRACILGCGRAFITEGFLGPQVREDIIPRAASHVNRFVREAIMYLLEAVADVGTLGDLCEEVFDVALAGLLAKGLCDNWSQVRW